MIPLLYKDRRKTGETVLRQAQLTQLHMLCVFDDICKRHGLRYYLSGGSLLGAVRHRGFIPWDDDLDVMMPIADYRRFLKIAPAELPKDVTLQLPRDRPRVAVPYAKLRDAYSLCYEVCVGSSLAEHNGIFLDVFPLEDVPNIGGRLSAVLRRLCCSFWNRQLGHLNRMIGTPLRISWHLLLYTFYRTVHCLIRLLIRVLLLIFPAKHCTVSYECSFRTIWRKALFKETLKVPFEDMVAPIPSGYDECLRAQYGDWHWIPPPEQRPRHATLILPMQAPGASWAMEYPKEVQ